MLINGASGGVGTFAVQIAKALGAEVSGVCSGSKAELMRSIGGDHVVDDRRPTSPTPAMAATSSSTTWETTGRPRRAVPPPREASSSPTTARREDPGSAPWAAPSPRSCSRPSSPGRAGRSSRSKSRPDLLDLTEFIDSGALRPVIAPRIRSPGRRRR
jgi:NADPH:quinone reductase-like Zn-dependent oxidoreductase